jgi:hypothetical protein
MYPGYRFEVIANHSTLNYEIDVHKGKELISKFSISSDTPQNEFWQQLQSWMRPILMHNR